MKVFFKILKEEVNQGYIYTQADSPNHKKIKNKQF